MTRGTVYNLPFTSPEKALFIGEMKRLGLHENRAGMPPLAYRCLRIFLQDSPSACAPLRIAGGSLLGRYASPGGWALSAPRVWLMDPSLVIHTPHSAGEERGQLGTDSTVHHPQSVRPTRAP